ncbi:uncharacterized protein [Battus philenor]|uniref:uncharacterized protein n=1 Tax=Battus philenor TaxID=42288 RepID=UPI0035D0A702
MENENENGGNEINNTETIQEKENEPVVEPESTNAENKREETEEQQDSEIQKDDTEQAQQDDVNPEGQEDANAEENVVKEEKPDTGQEVVEEEEVYVEEPPPDPAAPYNLRDSTEALKPPFELRPDQLVEVEQLWEFFQDYNPAYTDLDNYITDKELVYMLKSLLLMTYTPEQLVELIEYCVRPPHPKGHITYEQFLKMVTIRQRELPMEEELRLALQSLDPGRTGTVDREFFKELLLKQGHKLPQKLVDNLVKEVDLSNDGTIGIEDVVGTMGIDLNRDDILMLRAAIYPDEAKKPEEEEF